MLEAVFDPATGRSRSTATVVIGSSMDIPSAFGAARLGPEGGARKLSRTFERSKLLLADESHSSPVCSRALGWNVSAEAIPVPISLATPTPHVPAVSAESFARNGFLSIESLTTLDDIELIRSLLDPLFDRFDSLGDRAADLAEAREPGVALRPPEINPDAQGR
jgi:hypothetical protein